MPSGHNDPGACRQVITIPIRLFMSKFNIREIPLLPIGRIWLGTNNVSGSPSRDGRDTVVRTVTAMIITTSTDTLPSHPCSVRFPELFDCLCDVICLQPSSLKKDCTFGGYNGYRTSASGVRAPNWLHEVTVRIAREVVRKNYLVGGGREVRASRGVERVGGYVVSRRV